MTATSLLDRVEDLVQLPPTFLFKEDYDYVRGAILERGTNWQAFIAKALVSAAHQ